MKSRILLMLFVIFGSCFLSSSITAAKKSFWEAVEEKPLSISHIITGIKNRHIDVTQNRAEDGWTPIRWANYQLMQIGENTRDWFLYRDLMLEIYRAPENPPTLAGRLTVEPDSPVDQEMRPLEDEARINMRDFWQRMRMAVDVGANETAAVRALVQDVRDGNILNFTRPLEYVYYNLPMNEIRVVSPHDWLLFRMSVINMIPSLVAMASAYQALFDAIAEAVATPAGSKLGILGSMFSSCFGK